MPEEKYFSCFKCFITREWEHFKKFILFIRKITQFFVKWDKVDGILANKTEKLIRLWKVPKVNIKQSFVNLENFCTLSNMCNYTNKQNKVRKMVMKMQTNFNDVAETWSGTPCIYILYTVTVTVYTEHTYIYIHISGYISALNCQPAHVSCTVAH